MFEQLICGNPALNKLICEPLSFGFMRDAVLAALMLGLASGVVGAYVVVRGLAFMTDALAHAIMPGVAIAYLSGGIRGPLMLGAIIAGGITSVIIGLFTRGGRVREDTAIGIVFTGALALGLAILSLRGATAAHLEELLLGNILALNQSDLILMAILTFGILLIVRLLYKEWLITTFDPVLGVTLQYPVEGFRYLLLFILSITTVIALQSVGLVLITAMLVTPAATAYLLVRRLHLVMILGAELSCLSGVVGVFLAWHLSLSPSAAIVLVATTLFVLAYLFAPGRGVIATLIIRLKGKYAQ